jgi:malonyl-CoA O-methyltransferase
VRSEGEPVQILDPATAYACWAASYPPHAHNPLMQAEERAMLSLLPSDLRGHAVLDAGCGSGRYLIHALRRGARQLAGVDLSAEMLQRASAELKNAGRAKVETGSAQGRADVQLIQGKLDALPLRDQWADLAICGLTIGHLHSLEAALAELQRVTRPGGSLFCSDFHPLGHALGWRREFSAGGQRYAVHHTPHLYGDWQRACAALGWRIERKLEPRLEPADIPVDARFDSAALEMPVAIVLELRNAGLQHGSW